MRTFFRGRSALLATSAALCLFTCAGCVRESTENGASTFRYESWVPVCTFLGCLVAIPAGWIIRRRSKRYGWGLVVLGPLGMVFLAPSLLLDRVIVDRAGIHSRTGIWGMTAVHDLLYQDVKVVKIISESRTSRRGGKQTSSYLLCALKSGGSAKMPINNSVQQAAAPTILKHFEAAGVPIVDERGSKEVTKMARCSRSRRE